MKVGVLTFHSGPNYGGHFQALCLSQAIAKLGHEVEIINYKNVRHFRNESFRPLVYRNIGRLWHDWKKHQVFRAALSDLPLSNKEVETKPEAVAWGAYDAIVVGSDIVWNFEMERLGKDGAYFGRFPTAFRGRLVAYAPSIGPMPPDHPMPSWAAEALRRFDFIGARDVNTARFVERHVGMRPEIVADPTWLVPPIAPRSQRRDRFDDRLLVYSFPLEGKHSRTAKRIAEFAAKNGLTVHAAGYHQSWAQNNHNAVSVSDWQRMFGAYRYVVSGTFHGGLFAIREEAPFCIISHDSIDSKLVASLRETELEHRLITSPCDLEEILMTPVDYSRVNELRKAYAGRSLALLAEALS